MKKKLAMLTVILSFAPVLYCMESSKAEHNWFLENNRTGLEQDLERRFQRPLTPEEIERISAVFAELREKTQSD